MNVKSMDRYINSAPKKVLKDYGFLKNNDGFLGNAFRMTVERTMYSKRTLLMKMLSFITDLHSRYVCSPFMIITGR